MIDHEARKGRLGASEVAAILGENPDCTPLEVWEVKTGRRAHFEGNEHTRRGNRQERSILDWLSEDLGVEILRNPKPIKYYGSKIACATPDGLAMVEGDEFGMFHIESSSIPYPSSVGCEVKSTLKRIKFAEDLPTTWIIQGQWNMLCSGLTKWHLAIHGPMVSDYQRFEICFDEKFALELLALAEEWWEKHIVNDLQPEPINTADVLHLWPVDDGSTIEAVPAVAEAIEHYKALGKQISDMEKERETLKDRITPAIGPAQVVMYMGQKLATFKTIVRNDPPREAKTITYRSLRV